MTSGSTSGEPRRRLPRAEREAQMLDAARRVFAERGFHAATMDDIAAEVGVAKQLVYTYLGSKEELFLRVYADAATDLEARIDAAAVGRAEPDRQLWEGVLAFFAFVDEQREAWSVVVGTAGGGVEPFAGEVARLRGSTVRLVAQLFAEARLAAGRPADDTEPAARALVAAGEAIAAWWLEHPEVSREAAARRLMEFAWIGLRGLVDGEGYEPVAS